MCKQRIRGVQVFCKRHLGVSFLDLHKDKKRRIVTVGLTTRPSAAQPSDTSSCQSARSCSKLCDRLTNLQLQREKSAVKLVLEQRKRAEHLPNVANGRLPAKQHSSQ